VGAAGPAGPQGPAGADGVLDSAFLSGDGNSPTSALAFLSPTVQLKVGAGEAVHAIGSKALGSTADGGGIGLDLFICFRDTTIGSPAISVGYGIDDLAAPHGSRQLHTLSADFNPGVGTFQVGLCGSTPSPASWNHNSRGYVTAMVHE
jgi:hypothetical protein